MSQFIEMFENVESYCKLEDLISDTFPGEWGSEPISENAIKVIRTTNFTNEGYLDLTDVVTRDIEPKKVVRKKLKQGDTILERSGGTKDNPVGRVVFFDEIGDYLPNNFTQVLRPKESVNPVYLFYALYNSYNLNKAAMRAMASQTTGIQNLSMSDFMAKSIVLPSRDEQNKFEQIYRQADKSKFDDFKSQFIEMFGNSPQKELGELATFVNGSAFKPEEWSQEGLPIVRIQNLTQGDAPYNYYSGDTSKKVCLNTGDILVSWSATLGVFTWSKGPALLNQHIFKVVFDKLDIEQSFFIYTVKLALEKMADKAHGSTMRHVVKKDFDSTKVSFPSMREQQRFVSIAEQADKSKSVIQKALVYLNDIQSGELGKIA